MAKRKKDDLIKLQPQELIDIILKQDNEAIETAAAVEAEKKELQATIEEQNGVIADLNKRFESATKDVPQRTIVEHEGKSYEVMFEKFRVDGKERTKAECKDDKDLVKALVDKKSAVLREVPKK